MRAAIAIGLAVVALGVVGTASAVEQEPQVEESALWAEAHAEASPDGDIPAESLEGTSTPFVEDARAGGATVRTVLCRIENFRLFRTTLLLGGGHLVVTPSGNVTLVCHAQVPARLVRGGAPTQAVVVESGTCEALRFRFAESHLVLTPTLNVHVVCHLHPNGQQ